MSLYCQVQTQFKNESALVEALMETGKWTKGQIDIYQTASHLFGYKGDQRPEVANVIIKRQFMSGASNDIGFIKNEDGTYSAIVSQYDKKKYNDVWMQTLKANYAYHAIRLQQEARGRRVSRERLPDGRQRVKVVGYR